MYKPGSATNSQMTGDVLFTRSQAPEDARRNTDENILDPHPRTESQTLRGVVYASPVSFHDILHEYIRIKATIPCPNRLTVLVNYLNYLSTIGRYIWDGPFF